MVEVTFSDKLNMFLRFYHKIVEKNKSKARLRDRGCKQEELAEAVPIEIKVMFLFCFMYTTFGVPDRYRSGTLAPHNRF